MKQTSYRTVDQIFPACMPVLRMAQVKKKERNREFREHSQISCKWALAICFAATTLQRLSLAKCGGSLPSMMNYDLEVPDEKNSSLLWVAFGHGGCHSNRKETRPKSNGSCQEGSWTYSLKQWLAGCSHKLGSHLCIDVTMYELRPGWHHLRRRSHQKGAKGREIHSGSASSLSSKGSAERDEGGGACRTGGKHVQIVKWAGEFVHYWEQLRIEQPQKDSLQERNGDLCIWSANGGWGLPGLQKTHRDMEVINNSS